MARELGPGEVLVSEGDVLEFTGTGDEGVSYGVVKAVRADPRESRDGTWPWAKPPEFAVVVANGFLGSGVHSQTTLPARPDEGGKVCIVPTPPEEVAALQDARYGTKATLSRHQIRVVPPGSLPPGIQFSFGAVPGTA